MSARLSRDKAQVHKPFDASDQCLAPPVNGGIVGKILCKPNKPSRRKELSTRSTTPSDRSCSPIQSTPPSRQSRQSQGQNQNFLGKRDDENSIFQPDIQPVSRPDQLFEWSLFLSPSAPQLQRTREDELLGIDPQEIAEMDRMFCSPVLTHQRPLYQLPREPRVQGASERESYLNRTIWNMVRTSRLQQVAPDPLLEEIFNLFVDAELSPIQHKAFLYYAIDARRPSQLTNKFHGYVRKQLKQLSGKNLQRYFNLSAEDADKVGNIPDVKTETRKIMISNPRLRDTVFSLEFFCDMFNNIQKNSESMTELLLDKVQADLKLQAGNNSRVALSDSLKSSKTKKPFTVVENYWSAILYCNEFSQELRNSKLSGKEALLTRLEEIKAFFQEDLRTKGLEIEEELHPRPARYNIVGSQKGVRFQAYLIRTG